MEIPLTQSKEWQKFEEDLGEKCFYREERDYQFLAIKKSTPFGSYLFLPYGPVAENKLAFNRAIKTLNVLAREENAFFIRIEPTNPDYVKNLKHLKKSKDLSPKETWRLDLAEDEKQMVLNFSHGTRSAHNTYTRKGLDVITTKDPNELTHLVDLQTKLFKEKKLNPFDRSYLEAELKQPFATLYEVIYRKGQDENKERNPAPNDGQVLAISLFFDYKDRRYYMQSASDQDFRKIPATVALLSRAIFDAKAKGIKTFDFWGIAPDGAPDSHPWKGFTSFKKSFGGYEVQYAGTHDIVLKPIRYRFYQLIRKINLVRRHV